MMSFALIRIPAAVLTLSPQIDGLSAALALRVLHPRL